MTEDEAKGKWCPFGRVGVQGISLEPIGGTAHAMSGTKHALVVNRGQSESEWTFCIGSACMAWRWHYEPIEAETTTSPVADTEPATPDGPGWVPAGATQWQRNFHNPRPWRHWKRQKTPSEGFCGLAGAPQ